MTFEKLDDLAVQASEIVAVPLPRLVAIEPSVVLVFVIQGQFELFSDVEVQIAELAFKSPVLNLVCCSFAVANSGGDFVRFHVTDRSRPDVDCVRLVPIRSNGIRDALRTLADSHLEAWEYAISLSMSGQRQYRL